MRRYWLPASAGVRGPQGEEQFLIEGEELRHIRDVCRQEVGDRFEVLIGDGRAALVEVKDVQKRRLIAEVKSWRQVPELPEPRLGLALCLSRPAIFDAVVEKAVELGVETLQPLTSERSFWSSEKSAIEKKLERAGRIVRSATQQSGRGELMVIEPVLSLKDWVGRLNRSPHEACLFLYEGSEARPLRLALEAFRAEGQLVGRRRIWALVGAEGGFSSQEANELQSQGHLPLSLGQQVLRVETACVATLSVLKYELGLMG